MVLKEKIGEIRKRLFMGFFIGITMLMLSYVLIFLVLGEKEYQCQISQLNDVKILILQMISAGIAYYCLFGFFEIINLLQEKDEFYKKHPYKTVIIFTVVLIVITIIDTLLLENKYVFSQDIAVANEIIFWIIFVINSIILMIKEFINSKFIKKINQKLKERNK